MNRLTRNVLVGCWALLVAWSLLPRLTRLAARQADGEGDPQLSLALRTVQAMAPESPDGTLRDVLLVLRAPAEEREYLEFRSKVILYPVRAMVVFRDGPASQTISITAAEASDLRERRIRLAAAWERGRPVGRMRIVHVAATSVRLAADPGTIPAGELPSVPPAWGSWLGAVGLLAFGVRMLWSRLGGSPVAGASGWNPGDLAGKAGVVLALVLATITALRPQSTWSTWDAWAVWDIKVYAMRSEGLIPRVLLTDPAYRFSHPEYPLAWPWLQTVLCRAANGLDPRVLRLTSVLAAAAMPFMLVALLAELGLTRGRWLIAGGVALLPHVLEHSANGYVDWPLAGVEAATLVLLLRARRGVAPAWSVGALAGCAANLKQEGLIFGLGVLGTLGWRLWRTRSGRSAWAGAILTWLALALPWRIVAWQLHLVPADFGATLGGMLATVPGRIGLVVRAFWLEAFGPGLGGASFAAGTPVPWQEWLTHVRQGWLLFWFVATWIFIRGWRGLREPRRRDLLIVLGVQVLMALVAYGATVRDPRWLLAASLDRLMLQWVPVVTALAASLAVDDRRPGV